MMTSEQEAALKAHAQAIAAILYEQAEPEPVKTLAMLEKTVREQVLEHFTPEIGIFFIRKATGTESGRPRKLKSILGELPISSKQAEKLEVKAYNQLSPYLERCCVRSSANVSYKNAAKDVEFFTGIKVSSKTQQRLVHRQEFNLPQEETPVEELSVDGGKVRLRTPKGEPSHWRDYKAVRLHEMVTEAWFQENDALVNWVKSQTLASPLTCIGDGHDGIWNIIEELAPFEQRREILDWYHLKQNLYNIGEPLSLLQKAESLLWQGKVEDVLTMLADSSQKQAQNFRNYPRACHQLPVLTKDSEVVG